MFHSARDLALYHYASYCALGALVRHATRCGRGWYHFVGGELMVVTEVAL